MTADNRSFLKVQGYTEIVMGPGKESFVRAFFERSHVFFQVQTTLGNLKVHVHLKEIGYFNQVSSTAFYFSGSLRGFARKLVDGTYDCQGNSGRLRFLGG